jgi:hypothetical protein
MPYAYNDPNVVQPGQNMSFSVPGAAPVNVSTATQTPLQGNTPGATKENALALLAAQQAARNPSGGIVDTGGAPPPSTGPTPTQPIIGGPPLPDIPTIPALPNPAGGGNSKDNAVSGGAGQTPPPAPPPTTPPGTTTPPPGGNNKGTSAGGAAGQGAYPGVPTSLLKDYASPFPSVADAYLKSLTQGGPIKVPTFQELYGSFRNVAEEETNRQAAGLREAFGSRGARFGSDVLGAEGQLRRGAAADLGVYGGQLLQNLRGQQFQEASALGSLEFGRNEAAMARLFQDFLRRTSPPPFSGGTPPPGSPTTVIS